MGVTISITNNVEFCKANNLVGETVYSCQCVDFPYEDGRVCRECKGTGKVRFDDYPFELSICYSSWGEILETLHLNCGDDFVVCGSIDPQIFIDAARMSEARDLNKPLAFYMSVMEIACEARHRKEKLCWG